MGVPQGSGSSPPALRDGPGGGFLKDFGLALFVFAPGRQMGPGFFASSREQGPILNGDAFAFVADRALRAVAGGRWLDMSVPAIARLFAGNSTTPPSEPPSRASPARRPPPSAWNRALA